MRKRIILSKTLEIELYRRRITHEYFAREPRLLRPTVYRHACLVVVVVLPRDEWKEGEGGGKAGE